MSVSTLFNHKQGLMKKERLITIEELVEWLGFTKNQKLRNFNKAGVVELVDAPDSKSGILRNVGVRVPPPAF